MRDVAYQLREAAREDGVPLSLLPFDRYDPDDRYWWLRPTRNPAFCGKIVAAAEDAASPADLFVGFYTEKGIGETARSEFASEAGPAGPAQ